MREKGFALLWVLIVGVLVISAVVGIAYFKVQTKSLPRSQQSQQILIPKQETVPFTKIDETVDWKTYSNSELSFSLKHPSHYKVTEGKKEKGIQLIDFTSENFKFNIDSETGEIEIEEGQSISVIVESLSMPKTLADLVEEERKTAPQLSTSSTTLGGVEAVRITYNNPTPLATSDTLIAINGNKAYAIWVNTAKKNADLMNTYKTILSTFKFLD
ncbi:hypothetical protein A2773_05960 [Candidatus Gottesmanbacteria bacterium RIFCSPHIGHO2_01_FULL_39_10]|uniref:Uncharacterized protein n=1 Tax=Candidatus Gottesmanbacteria bacterium RIFCSPHIGHO2_01_FULL_39_10 TaxID=1798375 RepID=A0A1F5ZN94_9BACT|nr:MAG: hypothetical protein A2773_05960 [Candidatus Gottesmanbacteria bacterium RIFCSPHIGHO2_01_FULL_39_10]